MDEQSQCVSIKSAGSTFNNTCHFVCFILFQWSAFFVLPIYYIRRCFHRSLFILCLQLYVFGLITAAYRMHKCGKSIIQKPIQSNNKNIRRSKKSQPWRIIRKGIKILFRKENNNVVNRSVWMKRIWSTLK